MEAIISARFLEQFIDTLEQLPDDLQRRYGYKVFLEGFVCRSVCGCGGFSLWNVLKSNIEVMFQVINYYLVAMSNWFALLLMPYLMINLSYPLSLPPSSHFSISQLRELDVRYEDVVREIESAKGIFHQLWLAMYLCG